MIEPGTIYTTANCGDIMVGELVGRTSDRHGIYRIKFMKTGYESEAIDSQIKKGQLKDKLCPSIAGIGCIGRFPYELTYNPYVEMMYYIWKDMLNRCYNPNDKDYKNYGAIGIVTDIFWWAFDNFLRDIRYVPGHYLKVAYPDIYQLDKDYLQRDIPKSNRIYSKSTCMWISKYDNTAMMNFERGSNTGYIGVREISSGIYVCNIFGIEYGRFTNKEAAANLFNYMYPIVRGKFNNINFQNQVPYMAFDELHKYAILGNAPRRKR